MKAKTEKPRVLFHAEGNMGADYIELVNYDNEGKLIGEDLIHLIVGHCCVIYVDAIMPTEVLTGILANLIDAYKNPFQRQAVEVWGKEYGKELSAKIIDYEEKRR